MRTDSFPLRPSNVPPSKGSDIEGCVDVVALLDRLAISAGQLRSAGLSSGVVDRMISCSFDLACGLSVRVEGESLDSPGGSGVLLPVEDRASEVRRVSRWREGVLSGVDGVASWRSGSRSSGSGFSTVLSDVDGRLPVAVSNGRCYLSLAAAECRSRLSKMFGKWPTLARFLSAPVAWLSVAKLSEYGLVRSADSKWHVVPLSGQVGVVSCRDIFGRLVQSCDDLLSVGDRRWQGTLLEEISGLSQPTGTFDVPELTDRLGGDEVGSLFGTSASFTSASSISGLPRYPFGKKVDAEALTELQADVLRSYYAACGIVRSPQSARRFAGSVVGSPDGGRSAGRYRVSARRSLTTVASSPASLRRPVSDWSRRVSDVGDTPSTAAELAGFGYTAVLREHECLAYTGALGAWPTLSSLLCTPRDIWDEFAFSGYALRAVDVGRYRVVQSTPGAVSLIAVFARVARLLPSYPSNSLASAAVGWADDLVGYHVAADRIG